MSKLFLTICVCLLFVSTSSQAGDRSPRTSHSDTLLTNCELILFGKEVPARNSGGVVGYLVARSDSFVTVNGVQVMSVATYFRRVPVSPSAERAARIIEAAASRVRAAKAEHNGRVIVDDKSYSIGQSFELYLPDEQARVSVVLKDDVMLIEYDGHRVLCSYDDAPPPLDTDLAELLVNNAFLGMVRALRPGSIVIKGRGYEYRYPLSRADEVRAAVRSIAESATVSRVNSRGVPEYSAVETSLGRWNGDLVNDIVTAAGR